MSFSLGVGIRVCPFIYWLDVMCVIDSSTGGEERNYYGLLGKTEKLFQVKRLKRGFGATYHYGVLGGGYCAR